LDLAIQRERRHCTSGAFVVHWRECNPALPTFNQNLQFWTPGALTPLGKAGALFFKKITKFFLLHPFNLIGSIFPKTLKNFVTSCLCGSNSLFFLILTHSPCIMHLSFILHVHRRGNRIMNSAYVIPVFRQDISFVTTLLLYRRFFSHVQAFKQNAAHRAILRMIP
jgi:hypothetical protein